MNEEQSPPEASDMLMNPMRELTWHERLFVAFLVGGLPALIIGFLLGLWGGDIGGPQIDLTTVLQRGAYCALFPMFLAWLAPRWWLIPALVYGVGFRIGFGFRFDEGLAGLGHVIVVPIYWLEGKRMIVPPPPSHPDLPWILAMALWLAGLAAILRRSTRFVAWLRRLEIRE